MEAYSNLNQNEYIILQAKINKIVFIPNIFLVFLLDYVHLL